MADSGVIFGLVQGKLIEMSEGPYLSEEVLQKYLQEHAKLLPGEQINPSSPCRWLLIAREMSVPDKLDGKERWALDHLFVDQAAIPTLVEVKKSSNTELRRQIIGQMMDYAANGSEYWTIGRIREAFFATCASGQIDERQTLQEFLAIDDDLDEQALDDRIESFWNAVEQNMRSGKIRLLFVADRLPEELRRVIEFLNNQMSPAEVLGVEIRQYLSPEMTTFVPRVFPQTFAAQDKKQKTLTSPTLDSVQVIIAAGAIPTGASIVFKPGHWSTPQELSDLQTWLADHPEVLEAQWKPETDKWNPLQWNLDGQSYSVSGLAKKIYNMSGNTRSPRGTACWVYDGRTLGQIANQFRGSG
jgi:hypothetical protein